MWRGVRAPGEVLPKTGIRAGEIQTKIPTNEGDET